MAIFYCNSVNPYFCVSPHVCICVSLCVCLCTWMCVYECTHRYVCPGAHVPVFVREFLTFLALCSSVAAGRGTVQRGALPSASVRKSEPRRAGCRRIKARQPPSVDFVILNPLFIAYVRLFISSAPSVFFAWRKNAPFRSPHLVHRCLSESLDVGNPPPPPRARHTPP